MSADKNESADALDPSDFSAPADDGDEENSTDLSVEPGETAVGRITDANLLAGSHGYIEVDGKTWWLNGSQQADLINGLLVGTPVCIEVDSEEQSFTPDDADEPVTFHEKTLKFLDE